MHTAHKIIASVIIIIVSGFVGWYFTRSDNSHAANTWWQPHNGQGLTWQWQLKTKGSTNAVDTSYNVDMYDIDLFDTPQATIDQLHSEGRIVTCYFSAGSIEYGSGRPDQAALEAISPSVIGNVLDDWDQEKWLNINNSDVRTIMAERIQTAKDKGCDAIEPDNVNAFEEDDDDPTEPPVQDEDGSVTGFNITYAQQLDYNRFLAQTAHTVAKTGDPSDIGISIALKNDIYQTADLVGPSTPGGLDYFDWALNEQCYEYTSSGYDECAYYDVFDAANKAVFGVEYSGSTDHFCPLANAKGRYWMKKRVNLSAWQKSCATVTTSLTPIYRLFNTVSGVHLYTRGEADRDKVLSKWSAFEFTDGRPAFYAQL